MSLAHFGPLLGSLPHEYQAALGHQGLLHVAISFCQIIESRQIFLAGDLEHGPGPAEIAQIPYSDARPQQHDQRADSDQFGFDPPRFQTHGVSPSNTKRPASRLGESMNVFVIWTTQQA